MIEPGTKLGPYEIVAPIGAGGMGEVYRARDHRLQRDVAIKVLPPEVASDPDRLRRFEQEALATAALSHPNILAVFDVGHDEETAYVVSELLEGRTLREVAAEGPLPTRKVADYGVQVANGLAASHAKGIVHRDLKPENLFVTSDERVKILDFGLAKIDAGLTLSPVESGVTGLENAETVAVGTEPGVVLGTLGYMAPEQVRGTGVDHRADFFSFGAILYELLTGRRAFRGDTPADTMTAILKEDPPELVDSGRSVPVSLGRVVERCLEKNPAVRFQSASDLAFALQTVGSDSHSGTSLPVSSGTVSETSSKPRWLPFAGAVLAGALVALSGVWLTSDSRSAPTTTSNALSIPVHLPEGLSTGSQSALSPNGELLVFEQDLDDEPGALWILSLTDESFRRLDGTEQGASPFWSPDGQSVGFFSDGKLRVLDLESGRVRVIAEGGGARTSGTWNQDGVILYSTEGGLPLMQVRADGRTQPVAASEDSRFRPHFLPDQRHYLAHRVRPFALYVRSLDSAEERLLLEGASEGKYLDGYLFFVQEGSLLAQPFDPQSQTLSDQPTLIAELGRYAGSTGVNYSVTENGLVAFRRSTGRAQTHLVWRGRDGSLLDQIEGEGSWSEPALAPGDGLLAAVRDEGRGTLQDVWLIDLSTGRQRQIASSRYSDRWPVWRDNSERLAYTSSRGPSIRRSALFEVDITGNGNPQRVADSLGSFGSYGRDGRHVVYFTIREGKRDLIVLPLFGDREPFDFAQSPNNETQGTLSPDSRWMVYTSYNRRNQHELYIEAFPGGGSRQLVSGDQGGSAPRWRKDGKELYYIDGRGRMSVVSVVLGPNGGLTLGQPETLFGTPARANAGMGSSVPFDVTEDGQRFVVAEPRSEEDRQSVPFTLLVNWRARLQQTQAGS